MIGIAINLTQLAASEIKAILVALTPRKYNAVVLRAAVNAIRKHFYTLNSQRPNRLGGKRTNLWTQFARSTQGRDLGDGALISVNHVAARQRYYGGTIRPRNGKMLTIPYRAIAYGKRAREFSDLKMGFVEINGKKIPALVQKDSNEPYYLLARKVVQTGDQSIIPSKQELRAECYKALELALQRNTGAALS